jgi:hypothetical protein
MAEFDTLIELRLLPGEDDLGGRHTLLLRSGNVRITYTDDMVTIFGLGLYPFFVPRSQVTRMEAWMNG